MLDPAELLRKGQEKAREYRLVPSELLLTTIDACYQELFDLISIGFQMKEKNKIGSLLRFITRTLDTNMENKIHLHFLEDGTLLLYYNPLLLTDLSLSELVSLLEIQLEFAFSQQALLESPKENTLEALVATKEFLDNNRVFFQELLKEEETSNKPKPGNLFSLLKFYFENVEKQTGNFSHRQNEELIQNSEKLARFLEKLLSLLSLDFDCFETLDFDQKKALQQFWNDEATLLLRSKERGTHSLSATFSTSAPKKKEIPWYRELECLVGTIPYGQRHTKMRLNRRQPLRADLSGILSDRKIHLVCAIDTSYSMDEDVIKKALNQIYTLKTKYGFQMTLIQCDSEIKDVREIRNNQDFPERIVGRGGTAFSPVVEYLNEHPRYRSSVLVYFTDGRGEKSIPKPRVRKVLWILTDPTRRLKLSLDQSYGIIKYIEKEA